MTRIFLHSEVRAEGLKTAARGTRLRGENLDMHELNNLRMNVVGPPPDARTRSRARKGRRTQSGEGSKSSLMAGWKQKRKDAHKAIDSGCPTRCLSHTHISVKLPTTSNKLFYNITSPTVSASASDLRDCPFVIIGPSFMLKDKPTKASSDLGEKCHPCLHSFP